jgi:hypothetical protein
MALLPMDNRLLLYGNGYHCLAYAPYSKCSFEPAWQILAMLDPPAVVSRPYDPSVSNTGIMANGLRPVDIDLPNGDAALTVARWCFANLGDAPVRYRDNSRKLLLLYRAASGEPTKRRVRNSINKDMVEILGRNNQFHSFGTHDSGVPVKWMGGSPETVRAEALTPITEEQVDALLSYTAQIISASVSPPRPVMAVTTQAAEWEIVDVRAALAEIDVGGMGYDERFRIASATFSATGGSKDGYDAFLDWFRSSPSFSLAKANKLWSALGRAGARITAGTLYHNAKQSNPGWIPPTKGLMQVPDIF